MTVRAATKGDAVAIADIRAAIVADPWITFTNMVLTPAVVAREIAEVQAQGHGYLVALDNAGQVAGFAYYKQFRSGVCPYDGAYDSPGRSGAAAGAWPDPDGDP